MKQKIKITESQLKTILMEIEKNKSNNDLLKESKEFINFVRETKKQKLNEGLDVDVINEQLGDWLSSFFTDDEEEKETKKDDEEESSFTQKTIIDTGKQWMIGWILEQMGVTGELNRIMKIALSEIDTVDLPKLFDPTDNCQWLSDVLFEGLLEYIVQKLIEGLMKGSESSSLFSTAISKSFKNLTDNLDFKRDMKHYVGMAVCQALGGKSEKMELSRDIEKSNLNPKFKKGVKSKLTK